MSPSFETHPTEKSKNPTGVELPVEQPTQQTKSERRKNTKQSHRIRVTEKKHPLRADQELDPVKVADSAMVRYYMTFNAAVNRGKMNPEMQTDLVKVLRDARQALEDKQAQLTKGSALERKQAQTNWNIIKHVEHMLDISSQMPESAIAAYTAEMQTTKPMQERQGSAEKIRSIQAHATLLSKQIKKEYGLTPEEIVAGALPKTFGGKVKLWARKMTGNDLISQWHKAQTEEESVREQSKRRPVTGREAVEIQKTETDYIKSNKQVIKDLGRDAASIAMPLEGTGEREEREAYEKRHPNEEEIRAKEAREGREYARAHREEMGADGLPAHAATLEKEYLGTTDLETWKETEEIVKEDLFKKEQALANTEKMRKTEIANIIEHAQDVEKQTRDLLGPALVKTFIEEIRAVMGSDATAQIQQYGFTSTEYLTSVNDYLNAVHELVTMDKAHRDAIYQGMERRIARLKDTTDTYRKKLNLATNPLIGSGASRLEESHALGKTWARGELARETQNISGIATRTETQTRVSGRRVTEAPSIALQTETEKKEEKEEEKEEISGVRKKIEKRANLEEIMRTTQHEKNELQDMHIDYAKTLVPDAAKLWDLATTALQKHLDAELTFIPLRPKDSEGVYVDSATQYVFAIARYVEARTKGDEDEMRQRLATVHHLNSVLGLAGNALVQKILAEKRGVKDVTKGARSRAEIGTRQRRRWSGK